MGWLKTPTRIFAHLVPIGTPVALIPLMVIIEITRNLIRPITLRVRLAANITAGHLLLNLLGGQTPSSSYPVSILILTILLFIGILELAVSVIQAYVFSVLSTLYFNEVMSKKIRS